MKRRASPSPRISTRLPTFAILACQPACLASTMHVARYRGSGAYIVSASPTRRQRNSLVCQGTRQPSLPRNGPSPPLHEMWAAGTLTHCPSRIIFPEPPVSHKDKRPSLHLVGQQQPGKVVGWDEGTGCVSCGHAGGRRGCGRESEEATLTASLLLLA